MPSFEFKCLSYKLKPIRYWIEQVDAINDIAGTKPIFIVGTHVDKLTKKEREALTKEIEQLYPVPTQKKVNRSQIQGHFTVDLSEKGGAGQFELKNKLYQLALSHDKIGVGRVHVPRSFVVLQNELQELRQKHPYLYWQNYAEIAEDFGTYYAFLFSC